MTPVVNPPTEEPGPGVAAPSPRRLSFFQGVTYTSAGTALNIIFLLLETMVAVRVLDTESYGIYALLVIGVNFLVMLTDFGLTTSVTQLIAGSNPPRQATLASSAIVFRFAVVVVVSGITLLVPAAIFLLDPSLALLNYVIYIPVMLIMVGLDESLFGILQGYKAFQHMAIANGLRTILRLGLSVVFLLIFQLGIKGLIYSWIISFGVAVIYQVLVLPHPRRFSPNWHVLGEMLRFGFPLQLNRFLWFVSGRADILLLGAFMGPSAVALFEVAGRIPSALVRLTQSYSAVYFPTMTELLSKGETNRAHQLLNRSLVLVSFFMALAALISVIFGQEIIRMLFSAKYEASSMVFSLLMIGLQMNVLVTLMGYTLTSAGYPGRSLAANAIRETLIVVADLILIPLWGLIGPAFGKLAAYYMANPLSIWMLRRSRIRVVAAPYIKQTALLWLGAILFWWLQPQGFLIRAMMVILFIVINVALSTISRDDLALVLPQALSKRLGWMDNRKYLGALLIISMLILAGAFVFIGSGASNGAANQVSGLQKHSLTRSNPIPPSSSIERPLNPSDHLNPSEQMDDLTFYVSKEGNNTDGKSWETAWNEVDQIRWENVRPGDTIVISGGEYHTNMKVEASGVSGAPITITTNGKQVILDGQRPAPPYCGESEYVSSVGKDAIDVEGQSFIVIDGQEWKGIVLRNSKRGIMMRRGASNIIVRNVEIYDNGWSVGSGANTAPDGAGVELGGSDVLFERVIIHDNGQDAFQAGWGVWNFTLRNSWLYNSREHPTVRGKPFNYCSHTDGLQIYDGGLQGPVVLENNIIGPSFTQGIMINRPATVNNVFIKNTLFVSNGEGSIVIQKGGASSNWTVQNVTVVQDAVYESWNVNMNGNDHLIRDSIFWGGPWGMGIFSWSEAIRNYNWLTRDHHGVAFELDPMFLDDDYSGFQGSEFAEFDFSIQNPAIPSGTGASFTSVTQFFEQECILSQEGCFDDK
jgi:O-antigen/teichoic acid export membrane protein